MTEPGLVHGRLRGRNDKRYRLPGRPRPSFGWCLVCKGKTLRGRKDHASLRHGCDRGAGTAPCSRAGRGGSRGHRHHQDARQGRAAARGGREAGDSRRAGSRGGDRGGAGRGAGGDRAPDDRGGGLRTETDPPDLRPIRSAVQGPAAIAYVDATVPAEAPEGVVLRYGAFYGPGASDVLLEMLRKRQLPVIGGGTGIWSFIEITDAAAATLAAVEAGAPGIYNVVDDDPAPVAEWLPYLAQVAGTKPPLRVPAWLERLLAGEFAVAQMTSSRGSSNQKARKELGWVPRYASWREGFRAWVSG